MRATLALSLLAAAASIPAEAISDSYIIKFKDHVDDSRASQHYAWIQDIHTGGQEEHLELKRRTDVFTGMKHTFNIGGVFRGYAGHFHKSTIEKIRNHADVERIEPETEICVMAPVDSGHAADEDNCHMETQKQAPWGLARISHRDTLNFGSFNKYLYTGDGGEGVDVYVIDTGSNNEHVDFEGRASWGTIIPAGGDEEDGNGHGTHCSGIIAGKKYGVAKKAKIYAVKVFHSNGCGPASDVIKGIEYAAASHLEQVDAVRGGSRKGFKGSVANLSLGGPKTQALDDAVNAAIEAGVHFAVAAGNDNSDACSYSPAAASGAVTVGASTLDDSRAYLSNYGKCTDIFAPGLSIQSTWIGSKHAVNTITGTSAASAHVSGLLAYSLSLQPVGDSEYAAAAVTPQKLKDGILSIATKGALSDMPEDTPNLLAWNGCDKF